MKKSRSNPFSRRSALKAAAGCGLMSNTAIMSQFINLQATKAMASTGNPTGYKAIVCVFLAGAIDSFNLLSPYDGTDTTGERGNYLTARNGQRNAGNPNQPGFNAGIGLGLRKGGATYESNDYLSTQINGGDTQGNRNFGLHPGCGYEADPATVGDSQQTGAAGGYLYTGLNDASGGKNGMGTGIAGLYREGNLAFVANVGSLPYPITRAQYNSNEFQNGKPARPLGLFSHSDLQRHWQTSVPQSRAQVNGWGGRLADCFQATNGEATVSMNMSINGVNIFQTGTDVVPYTVGQGATATGMNGANTLNDYPLGTQTSYEDRAFNTLTDGILGQTYSDLVAESFRSQNQGSIQAALDFNAATNSIELTTPFEYGGGGESDLGRRLRQVARIIGCSNPSSAQYNAATSLNQTRQVFFVQEGGWDHHANMITSMDGKIHEVSKALTSFYRALEELGVADDVVTFTASDFGRTLRTNGIGSDHAWGGNHIIMGGGMGTKGTGGKIYGKYPTNLALPTDPVVGNLDVGQRRLIPTTAVDEFAAEMARWYGIDDQADLSVVLPNIGEFYNVDGASSGPLGIL
tara:strand:+ start:209782 stop:211509 length:1728 start_codon:yes stop_codon:yes gene_type:complete